MRDVVVIGGGLSGLAAAVELEQAGVDYTLIEVKRELGGSLSSLEQDGFVMDLGPMVFADTLDPEWLDSLGLSDALDDLVADAKMFKQGMGVLVEALAAQIAAPRLMRMAVSSIGELDNGRYSICLENGLLLDARALIIAVPARWAERFFYGYRNALTEALLDYQYDTIQRISLGFRSADMPAKLPTPPNMAHVFKWRTEHPARTPQGHTLMQFGLRLAPSRCSLDEMVDLLCQTFDLPQPITKVAGYWAEADPISCYDDAHRAWVEGLRQQLPDGIALIGSDYSVTPPSAQGIVDLQPRITQGQVAAKHVLAQLGQ